MPVLKLTKSTVDRLARNHSGPRIDYRDTEIKGFVARVSKTKVSFAFAYRLGGGRDATQKKAPIGDLGAVTPAQARETAKKYAAIVAQGGDPAGAIAEKRAAPTVASLMDRYRSDHAEVHKKASSTYQDERRIQTKILPALGKKKVAEVSHSDIERLHIKLKATPYEANRVLALLSKIFNLSETWGLRPRGSNPCADVKKYKEHRRERVLSMDDIARLARVLKQAERGPIQNENGREVSISPYFVWAVRLLYLTGARLNEIVKLRWKDVNFERAQLELPDSKTGAKVVLLSAPALEVLGQITRVTGNPYVIVGGKPGAHLVNMKDPWNVVRHRAGLDDVRLHDLRHNLGAFAASSGHSLPVIGEILGHTQVATTQRYAHFQDDPLRAEAEKIGQKLAEALKVESPEAKKVVKFPGK